MATIRVWSGSGVTQFALNTAYTSGNRIVPLTTDTGTNYLVARTYVWECTTGGTTDAAVNPTWPASVTPDVTTVTSNTATFTARNIGYSSGTTVNWTFATPIYLYACDAMSNLGTGDPYGDFILVHKTHQEEIAADRTFTYGATVQTILCVDKDSSEAPATMGTSGWIGNSTTNRGIINSSAGTQTSIKGITFRTAGASGDSITLITGDTASIQYEDCYIWHGNTATTSTITIGSGSEQTSYLKMVGCTFRFGHASQSILVGDSRVELLGCTLSQDGKIPTTLFTGNEQGPDVFVEGCDFSASSGKTLVGSQLAGSRAFHFSNCTLGARTTRLASTPSANKGYGEVRLYNTQEGRAHYGFEHHDPKGSTVAQTLITFNDGARYDGTMRVAWKITPVFAASENFTQQSYVSPWIDVYYDILTQVTPYLECLYVSASGAAGVVYPKKVWLELTYQGSAETSQSTFVSTRSTIDTSMANGTAWSTGAGTSAWSGFIDSNLYRSFKLVAPAFTPKSIGHIRARICAATPTVNGDVIYVDPQIRGLT